MKMIRYHLAGLALLLLAGCAQLGIPAPDSFNDRLALAYVTVAEVRSTTATLLTAKKISAEEAERVQESANVARQGLDVARVISKTDMTAAEGRVTAIRTTLQALTAYLASRNH